MDSRPASRLRVLLFTDVAGSVDLKRRIGNAAYGKLIARHDETFRAIVADEKGAEILNDTGDGFLAAFETASGAVAAALRFQDALARGPWEGERLAVRIGIHQGEVQSVSSGGEREKVVGLAADVAARVMGLAEKGRILLTRAVFDDARQALGPDEGAALAWRAYGRYLLQGIDEPVEIHGVGREGSLPSEPPTGSEKARRAVAADEEATLGWRPAPGHAIPGREEFSLERKLGTGGFGEVWLATRAKLGEKRVFKFCFEAEKLRSFRREIALFRLIRSALGERPDIARLHEVELERPPFYLESEFTEDGDLADWAARRGGIASVPLSTRLDLLARTADAVAAAHSVGVLHKDVKPSNVLVYTADGEPRPRLADFGIGILTDRRRLAEHDITASGFTLSRLTAGESSGSGTRLYSPPESALGVPFTTQGDVYALGVMLYQLVIGDLRRPLGVGWERDVADPILREDVAACVEGDPARRLASAKELAERLRALPARRRARFRRRFVRAGLTAALALAALGAAAAALYLRERDLRKEAVAAREKAILNARQAEGLVGLLRDTLLSVDPAVARGGEVTVREALDTAIARLESAPIEEPAVEAALRDIVGQAFFHMGRYPEARVQFEAALSLYTRANGADDPDTLSMGNNLAVTLQALGEPAEAERVARAAQWRSRAEP